MAVPSGYRAVPNSDKTPAPGAHKVGPVNPKDVISVSIRVRPQPGNPALDMARLTASPHSERKHFSREDFARTYGASQADLDAVTAFAQANGLKVDEVSAPRRTVRVSGTVEQMTQAFAVELNHYQTPKETYRGREGSVHIPENLADIVESIHGLDNQVRYPSPVFFFGHLSIYFETSHKLPFLSLLLFANTRLTINATGITAGVL